MTKDEALYKVKINNFGNRENVATALVKIIYDEFESRTCESCKHFNLEVGTQPDGRRNNESSKRN